MKNALKIVAIISMIFIIGCDGKDAKKKEKFSYENTTTPEQNSTIDKTTSPSKKIDLTNKGIGPVKKLALPKEINGAMAAQGETIFKNMCASCHRVDKKFIGPPVRGILERRTPEWIMNMIIDPEGMIKHDPLAKEVFMEYNHAFMTNQQVKEADARIILEYFRTLE